MGVNIEPSIGFRATDCQSVLNASSCNCQKIEFSENIKLLDMCFRQ